jgi:hypothetical protein
VAVKDFDHADSVVPAPPPGLGHVAFAIALTAPIRFDR